MIDDNGTPAYSGDDFNVGTVASLAPHNSATLTRERLMPVPLCADSTGQPSGIVIPEILANGDIRATFIQDLSVNDNTYGTNTIGWNGKSHSFGNLTGSDQAEFLFRNSAGQVVLRFRLDYITSTASYPSGYGTLGVNGGDGDMVTGSAASVLSYSTSLTENLNKQPFLGNLAYYTVHSPALNDPNSSQWEYRMIYSVVVDDAAFGAAGFGSVTIIDQHNSPQKIGSFDPVTCDVCVTNVALVSAESGNRTLTDSDDAVVCVSTNVPQCLDVTMQIACALPDDQCGGFGSSATGVKGALDPAFCYEVTVANCGEAGITNLTVVDDRLGDLTADFVGSPTQVLLPGESITRIYKVAWPASTTNTVTAAGRSAMPAGRALSDSARTSAVLVPLEIACLATVTSPDDLSNEPQMDFVQLPMDSAPHQVTFAALVRNPGTVDLTGVTISAPALAQLGCTFPPPFNLPAGNVFTYSCTVDLRCAQLPLDYTLTVAGVASPTSGHCVYDIEGNIIGASSICGAAVDCNPRPMPGLSLEKSADRSVVLPGGVVTYTYKVSNTGNVPLSDVAVRDDNGTPGYAGDDFVVGTIDQLPAYAFATFNRTIGLATPLCADNSGQQTGTIQTEVLPDGSIRATFIQSTTVNDNTYGANTIGWNRDHSFNNLVGSDQAEFLFRDATGLAVLRFKLDYISSSSRYPSGYGSLGVSGGDGKMVTGSAAYVLAYSTSLTENLNKQPFLGNLAVYTVNSPALSDPNSSQWEYRMIYSVVVSRDAFGANGFGSVVIVDQHNSPSKISDFNPVLCGGCVTNVAQVTATADGQPLLASDSATVCITVDPTDPNLDSDGDGAMDIDELIAGTDPNNPNSIFRIISTDAVPQAVAITWSSVVGKTYQIEYSPALNVGPWTTIATVSGQTGITTYVDTDPVRTVSPTGFYRVRVVP